MKHRQEEARHQESVVTYLRAQHPDVLFTTSPAGIKPGGSPKQIMIQRANMKRRGYTNGTPDLMLFEARGRWHGLLIEMKTEDGDQSDAQKEFEARASQKGYRYELCRGSNEAVNVIDRYMKWDAASQN